MKSEPEVNHEKNRKTDHKMSSLQPHARTFICLLLPYLWTGNSLCFWQLMAVNFLSTGIIKIAARGTSNVPRKKSQNQIKLAILSVYVSSFAIIGLLN